jgi:hypothetical protein
MAEWWAIEIFHGDISASSWQDVHASALLEAALTNGAKDASWRQHEWGVSFEVLFRDEEQWQRFRNLPAVRAALDSVPDPVNGLLIYRGRGGGAGSRVPRKPKRPPAAGAMELVEGPQTRRFDLNGPTPEMADVGV